MRKVKAKVSVKAIKAVKASTSGFLGSILGIMALLVIAMCFFIPGFIIVVKQHKKDAKEKNTGILVFGYVLMVTGMIVGLGFGAGAFLTELSSDL